MINMKLFLLYYLEIAVSKASLKNVLIIILVINSQNIVLFMCPPTRIKPLKLGL